MATPEVRRATVDDADRVAGLLHDFNTEFDTDSPGPVVLAERLRSLLAGTQTFALLGGEPAVGIALVTLRPNVWYPGPVALLDEMYVAPQARGDGIGGAIVERLVADCRRGGVSAIEINVDEGDVDAQRFYERHGFHGSDPQTDERAYYFFQEL
ncbi:MAG TPA: GNAT family N-acetyltransferase [Microbacterium sp.]|uniref:GNAT family N-acetyltransferase n=1 Tax=Microbacterium sp. TaxID=51671 RepID=UPI002F94D558